MKLNQIIAIEKGTKSTSYKKLTEIHKALQKGSLLEGLSRTYTPKEEDGQMYPPEVTRVQLTGTDALKEAKEALATLFDMTATKDYGNTEASADVVIDGVVLVKGAPVTFLLFLEKQLQDIKTLAEKMPVLDAAHLWNFDDSMGYYVTAPTESVRMKKVPRNHVKAEATKEHPAQVDVFTEDVPIGTWTTVKQSGAMPAPAVKAMLVRVNNVIEAIKFAREQANSTEVQKVTVPGVLDYIFD